MAGPSTGSRRQSPITLQIHLLGGFSVRINGSAVAGFESQKVRALLAYLACHRERPLGRAFLASLFWGDRPDRSARRNLRQALHNLRRVIAEAADPERVIVSTTDQVSLHPQVECQVDAEEFDAAYQRGVRPGGPDLYHLQAAARLYVGEFLPGFFLTQCPEFETWLLTMQERQREAAIQTFSTLAQAYLGRGEFHLGIQSARRLLAIEPMSEGAHRVLMRLYSLSGRPRKALELYEKLRRLLQEELGVEPLEETTALYESILESGVTEPERPEAPNSVAMPVIPLTGRAGDQARLQEVWELVLEGPSRLTLVTGEPGLGKSRLARTFVDQATSRRFSLVLRGQAHGRGPTIGLRPFSELVLGAFSELLPDSQAKVLAHLGDERAADLHRMVPALADAIPALRDLDASAHKPDFLATLSKTLCLLLKELEMEAGTTPVVLLLDDLQYSDAASLTLLGAFLRAQHPFPLWVLATATPDQGLEEWLHAAVDAAAPDIAVDRLPLERLDRQAVQAIASSLLGAEELGELGDALYEWSGGLPLAVAETINWLRDLRVLEPTEGGLWYLTRPVAEIEPPPADLHELIGRRVSLLPAAARRLISTAAVIGDVFEAELVRVASDEDPEVAAICLQRLLQRWLVRQSSAGWSRAGRETDLGLWHLGKRQGDFEFSHESIRTAVLEAIHPLRRQRLHGIVGDALSELHRYRQEEEGAALAHYYRAAGRWSDALPNLTVAAARALASGLPEVGEVFCHQAIDTAGRARGEARSDPEGAVLAEHVKKAEELLAHCEARLSRAR